MSVNYILIGKRVREVRKQRNISQALLGEKAGLSPQYVSQVETGRKKASLQALIHLARALEVSADTPLYGNLGKNALEYQRDVSELLEDCTDFERRVLFEVMGAVKKIVRDNLTA